MSDKKVKIQMEYPINASPRMIFNRISTPSGLAEWFCDDVNLRGGKYIFVWNDAEEEAKMLSKKENKHIRFQWVNGEEASYFEFKIVQDDLTDDVSLIVTDYVDEDEKDEAILLWDNQINDLRRTLGSLI